MGYSYNLTVVHSGIATLVLGLTGALVLPSASVTPPSRYFLIMRFNS